MVDYKFLNFFYKLKGGAVVPIVRGESRAPAKGCMWGSDDYAIDKETLIKDYSFERFNYSLKLPKNIIVIDVEAHKNGLKEATDLKESEGIDLFETYHHITGRGGVHAFYKVTPEQQARLKKGYIPGYDGLEMLKNGLSPIPPSLHYKTGKPYKIGDVKPLVKNIKPIPKFFVEKYPKPGDEEGAFEGSSQLITEDRFDDLEYCLKFLPVTEYRKYDQWVKILFSAWDFVKGHKDGLKIFAQWCIQDEKHKNNLKSIQKAWAAVKEKREENPNQKLITFRTIMYLAMKNGAKIKTNIGKLLDEILNQNFDFSSTIETGGEFVRDIVDGRNMFHNTQKETIGGKEWGLLTKGVIARIHGFIMDESGIHKRDYVEMRISDRVQRNQVSLFKQAWDDIAFKNYSTAKSVDDLKATRELFFNLITHVDAQYAEKVFPFFVKYLVSGIKANLSEFDDPFRSNSQTCLCISSSRQGIGKSTLARAFSPCPHLIYYPNLRNIRDTETKLAISRAAMCIIDDYQPTFQKELNNLNEILTQHSILARPKYGRIEETKTKRAFFALTTNYKKILNDYTGSRRWITIDLLDIKIDAALAIMPQVHGEMLSLARCENYRHWMKGDEITVLESLNEAFSGVETLDEILLNHYEVDNETNPELRPSPVDIMAKINRYYGNRSVKDVRQMGAAISRLFPSAETSRTRQDGRRVRVYSLKMVKPFNPVDTVF